MIQALIAAIENEEQRSLVERIYDEHYDKMYGIAIRTLKNAHHAQDAVSAAFIRIMKAPWRFAHLTDTELQALLHTVTKNVVLNYSRAQGKHKNVYPIVSVFENDENRDMDYADEQEALADLVIRAEQVQSMRRSIHDLPDEQQRIFLMHYYHHYSTEEIAEALHMNAATVRTNLRRARLLLREMI